MLPSSRRTSRPETRAEIDARVAARTKSITVTTVGEVDRSKMIVESFTPRMMQAVEVRRPKLPEVVTPKERREDVRRFQEDLTRLFSSANSLGAGLESLRSSESAEDRQEYQFIIDVVDALKAVVRQDRRAE